MTIFRRDPVRGEDLDPALPWWGGGIVILVASLMRRVEWVVGRWRWR